MSMDLMVQAMKTKVGNPLRKLVLLKLADNASDDGECWPSFKTIAEQCEISRRSVISHVNALEKAGLLKVIHRRKSKTQSHSNLYQLSLNGGAGDSPPDANAALPDAGDSPGGGAGAAPRTSQLEPVSESVSEPKGASAPKKKAKYTDEFEAVWKAYPKREGSHPKNKAFSAWNARIKEGVSSVHMAAGVARYAQFCKAKGIIGTGYVMQAQRFFGPGVEYENDWTPAPHDPAPNGRPQARHHGLTATGEGFREREDGSFDL